ncbi:MAG: tripartite tricarboxylate transporter substrate binding protein [Burkholderiales bacterium]|nr:tripartite tricarboxylate transporter substrate binding protein [Burkholderiales bacterium]
MIKRPTLTRALPALAIGMSLALSAAAPAQAQNWPERPIRIVVPYPAGGNADIIARGVAGPLSERLGQPIIVENKGGAAGVIGADAVAKAAPDGYTLLITPVTQLTSAPLGAKPTYRAETDFVPVAGIAATPLIYVAGNSANATDFKQFVAAARAKPFSFGSYGPGTSTHLLIAMMSEQLGLNMTHVPYKGENPMLTDLLSGQVQSGLLSIGITRAQVEAGKVKPLAVLGRQRVSFFPDVPTFTELGVKDLDWDYAVAMYAPAGVPKPILTKLETELTALLRTPAFRDALLARSNEPWQASSAELTKRLGSDIARWNKVLQNAEKFK